MKTKSYFILVFALMAMISSAYSAETISTGNSLTAWGEYKIVKETEPVEINSKLLESFTIYYENIETPVRISVDHKKKCDIYIVSINGFEVQYTCKNNSFGVNHVSPVYSTGNQDLLNAMLDYGNFNRQRNISGGNHDAEYLLSTIACYFPQLVKSPNK